MKTIKHVHIVTFSILLVMASCQQGVKETTPYGIIPPGDSAVLFAPGIISTGMASRDMAISPDGNEIYFLSTLVDEDGVAGDQDIWYVEKHGLEWSDPINPGPPINSEDAEYFPSLTRHGDMYFSRAEQGSQVNRLYRSRWVDGGFLWWCGLLHQLPG